MRGRPEAVRTTPGRGRERVCRRAWWRPTSLFHIWLPFLLFSFLFFSFLFFSFLFFSFLFFSSFSFFFTHI